MRLLRHPLIVIGVVLVVGISWRAQGANAQATGCCFNKSGFCVSGLSQLACDSTYTPGSAGSNFYAGKSCAQVVVCSISGKCQKTDGTNCSDKQKWECDDLYTQGYRFFAGSSCSGPGPVAGTCCVQQPAAGGTTLFCEDNIDAAACRDARLGTAYASSCSSVANCPQAITGTAIYKPPKVTEKISFTPEIPIPGLFSGTVTITGTTIVTYIRAIFIYFIWTVGILATVMVIYGGVKWVAAAGNPGRINDARDVINNAIIGVIIALISVVMLNIINSRLTAFQGVDPGHISKVLFDPEVTDEGTADLTSEGTLFKQCDTAWGNVLYPGPATERNSCTICSSGCGSTAVAIALAHLNVSTTPLSVAQYAMSIGARTTCSGGTKTSMIAEHPYAGWGVTAKTITDFSTAMKDLEQGKWMVVSIQKVPVPGKCARSECGVGICFCGGHYVVLTGKKGDNVTIADPSRVDIGGFSVNDLQRYLTRQQFYEFSR